MYAVVWWISNRELFLHPLPHQDSVFPTDMQPDPNLTAYKENLGPAKFDYKLNNIFRLHDLPVSW